MSRLPDSDASRAQLSKLITDSGLSINEFAKRVMGRDPTTLRAYLGGQDLPANVVSWIWRVAHIVATDSEISVTLRR